MHVLKSLCAQLKALDSKNRRFATIIATVIATIIPTIIATIIFTIITKIIIILDTIFGKSIEPVKCTPRSHFQKCLTFCRSSIGSRDIDILVKAARTTLASSGVLLSFCLFALSLVQLSLLLPHAKCYD